MEIPEENTFAENYMMEKIIGEIQSIIFFEKWYIDPETLRITKNITGLAPVKYFYRYGDSIQLARRVVFKIKFDNNKYDGMVFRL